jgi:hypothetical protein
MSILKEHSYSLGELQRPLSHLPVGSLRLPLSLLSAIGMLPKKGQGMPCPYLCYVSTFGYRYVAFNSYWFYASRVFDLQPLTNVSKNYHAKINILIIQKTKKYIIFNTLQILYHTMFLVMF